MIKSIIFASLFAAVLGQYGGYGQDDCEHQSTYGDQATAAAAVAAGTGAPQYTAVLQTMVPVTTPTMTGVMANLATYTVSSLNSTKLETHR